MRNFIIFILIFSALAHPAEHDSPFYQEIQKSIPLTNASKNIVQLEKFNNRIFAISTVELLEYNGTGWKSRASVALWLAKFRA